jgi:two-component system LytT family response regulator
MKVLIVDDETPARQQLRRALSVHPDVQVAGEAVNGVDALERIEELHPDVVFLDIEMPGLNGIEVASNLARPPLIVFVTAYDEYAVKAFEAHATDYLLKPLDEGRLSHTLDRLRTHLAERQQPDLQKLLASLLPRTQPLRIAARKGKRIVLLGAADIFYVTTEDKLVFVVTADARYLVDRTVADLETVLEPHGFFRISRSEIVNITHTTELIPWFNGTWRVKMSNGTELDVSRERARRLKELVGAV